MGLERTFYNVSEDVGVAEVCAIVYSPNITCPIAFPFNVSISTSDNTAGNFLNLLNYVLCYVWHWEYSNTRALPMCLSFFPGLGYVLTLWVCTVLLCM